MFRKVLVAIVVASGFLLGNCGDADAGWRRCRGGHCSPSYTQRVHHVEQGTPVVRHHVEPVQAVAMPPVTYDRTLVPCKIKVRHGFLCWRYETVYREKLVPRVMTDAKELELDAGT